LIECVVVARSYVDQDGNRLRNGVEYTLRDIHSGHFLQGARALHSGFGMANGEEITYHPATKLTFKPGKVGQTSRAVDTDGDLVLVGFISGSRHLPVILGGLPHAYAPYGARQSDGERRFLTHQGTTVEMRNDGSAVLTRPVEGSTPTKITILADGGIDVEMAARKLFRLRTNWLDSIEIGLDPDFHAMHWEPFRTWMTAQIELLHIFFVAYNALVTAFNLKTASTIPPYVDLLTDPLEDIGSTVVKVK
jgi:hypothetical protein